MLNSGRVSVRALGIGWSYSWTVGPILTRLAGLFLGHWIFPLDKKTMSRFISGYCLTRYATVVFSGQEISIHEQAACPPNPIFASQRKIRCSENPQSAGIFYIQEADILSLIGGIQAKAFPYSQWTVNLHFVFFLHELTISIIYIYFPREFGQVSKGLCASSVSFLTVNLYIL